MRQSGVGVRVATNAKWQGQFLCHRDFFVSEQHECDFRRPGLTCSSNVIRLGASRLRRQNFGYLQFWCVGC